ncbi:hypothetical protein ACIBG7_06010 [Nonomuraea sp. NPDC050328]|uniref:hypothetical protein n=1 Tax=Nonomuraea sp. NPDC050328 TaxID=3364361 RepID=UPI003787C8FF
MSTRKAPYTYATLSATSGRPPALSISFYDNDLMCLADVLTGTRPCLMITNREATVAISTTGAGPVTEADVAAARLLHEAAVRYLADCERLLKAEKAA